MGTRRRLSLGAGVVAIVAGCATAAYFLLRAEYQVLFSDLAPQDAAAMVAELDKLKVPYRLGGGDTILVPQDVVHKTRMKLMAKDVPLRGAVGFELFNNADFGMTEFAQKVNYQRALQGEITRTIMSMEDVLLARVHLAIPEQGLFKKSAAKPKASINLTLKPGRTLRPEQVSGIQRLVSAAIPDIATQDVTIVNQQGIALTRNAGVDTLVESSSTRLDAKRAAEEYLARKVADVLDRSLGAGQAMATIDVILNHDQSKVTVEDVLPAHGSAGGNPTGVIVRQRQLVRDASSSALPASDGPVRRENGSGHLEVDYQVGRRTEQVVSSPGAIQRLGVAVVVRAAADKAQLERIRNLVAVAVGYDSDRGDGIAVYSMEQLPSQPVAATPSVALPVAAVEAEVSSAPRTDGAAMPVRARAAGDMVPWLVAIAITLIAAAAVVLFRRRRRARLAVAADPAPVKTLTTAEREAMLGKVREWLQVKPAPSEARR